MSISLSQTTSVNTTLPPSVAQQIETLVQTAQYDELTDLLSHWLPRHPTNPELHHLLGCARTHQGRLPEAEAHYRDAIRLKPDAAGSYNNLGSVLIDMERLSEAFTAFGTAVRIQPDYVAALSNTGFALGRLGHFDRALPLLEKAIALNPDYAEARHHLGYVLMNLDRLDEAQQQLELAMARQPKTAGFVNTYGLLREHQHHIEEATALFHRAIEMQPTLAHAWNNLGNINAAVWGQLDEAITCFEKTLELGPHFAYARHHRGLVKLALGDFAGGWEDYEHRTARTQKHGGRYVQPMWRGEDLTGKTILLHCEQGLGDTLQAIRYARHIQARGARVICEVQKPLLPLLARTPGIDLLLAENADLPPHDYQIVLLSVPRLLGIPPNERPYLFAAGERLAFWKDRIQSIPGCKIGIAWQGDSTFEYDWLRSIPLAEFAPLAAVPNCRLINLQKFEGVEQIAANRQTVPVVELEPEIDTNAGPFEDTAAIMQHLDLVITSDTSIAHLAGGLGVPVWLATSYAPDWRWMMQRDDCLWYPTLRLFRQTRIRHWSDVFTRMAHELSNLTPAP